MGVRADAEGRDAERGDELKELRLGSHMSVAGGVSRAFERGEYFGCAVLQIFVKNNNRWRGTPLSEEEADRFHAERERTGIWPVFAHNTYLVNLASADPAIRERSIACTVDELERCHRLGLPWLVLHPGAHGGAGPEKGIERIAAATRRIFARTPQVKTRLLFETTAGAGTLLGSTAGELARILAAVDNEERTGICLDTCHVFAAGYELRSAQGYDATLAEFETELGLERLFALHLNDSLMPLGSRRDRHAHIGEGEIGEAGFRRIMTDPRLRAVPKVLETPKENDADFRNLDRLRQLAGKA
jgi:deoxyribonuclease-4